LRLAETMSRSLDQLPHAILLVGAPGLGKNLFAEWLSQTLLCDAPQTSTGRPCGQCQNCRLFQAGSHADLHVVQPESVYKNSDSLLARHAPRYAPGDKTKDSKDSTVIRIDQIRSLIAASQGRPQLARRRVVVISPADRMNVNASNALLKLLEEPPPDSQLILVTDRPMRLPATIRSRCMRLEFQIPPRPMAIDWMTESGFPKEEAVELLALSGGSPLQALDLGRTGFLGERDELLVELEGLLSGKLDPISCASRWKERGADRCLGWLHGWIADLAHPGTGDGGLHNPRGIPRLQALQKRLNLKQLFLIADQVGLARSRLGGSLDEQLALEETLISWTQLNSKTSS